METVDLAAAKTHLSELIDRVQAGDTIEITRRGKPVAPLSAPAATRRPIDAGLLQALTSTLPVPDEGAAELVRAMRDDRF